MPDRERPSVLQVVTLITPDGAYGGPVRVALNQSRQLLANGHRAVVAAATRGYPIAPTELDGVPLRLARARNIHPALGFAGLVAPALIASMVRHRKSYDVVHVHLARDLVTLPAAMLALVLGKRLILQTHGMVVDSAHPLAPVLDRLLTRPVLRRAAATLYLTEAERAGLIRVQPTVALTHLPNGVPVYQGDRETTDVVEILYLARLQERKRPTMFVRAAARLLDEGLSARFALVGPDEGEAARVRDAIARAGHDGIGWEGALSPEHTAERMARATCYVLPSVDEPFPMSVLEAMAVGLPVVITESCGLAEAVRASGSGIVVDESEDALVEAVRTLIADPDLRAQMGAAARRTAVEVFSMEAVTSRLRSIYAGG